MSRRTWRYARLMDGMLNHPKFIGLDPNAGWLWTLSLAYCHDQLSDGHIPAAIPSRLLGVSKRRALTLAGLLVEARLWDVVSDGWDVHNYLDWNESREEVLSIRGADADRKRAARAAARPPGRPPDNTRTSARIPPGRPAGVHPDGHQQNRTEQNKDSTRGESPTPRATPAPTASNGSHDPGETETLRTAAHPTALGEIIARGSATVNRRTADRVAELRRAEGKA